jgi:hypothetical protein
MNTRIWIVEVPHRGPATVHAVESPSELGAAVTAQRDQCADCGCPGVIVDTLDGEIRTRDGRLLGPVDLGAGEEYLLASAYGDGMQVCDACEAARRAACEARQAAREAAREEARP